MPDELEIRKLATTDLEKLIHILNQIPYCGKIKNTYLILEQKLLKPLEFLSDKSDKSNKI